MVAKKKKQQGHYCRICSEYKANEQFSGKGHSRHICKECRSLPDDVKADMVRCNEVERAVFKCPMSRQDWELLENMPRVQGQGIRAVRAGYVGHETGQSDTGRGYGRG